MKKRTGSNVDLIDSSLRTVSGTSVSTTIYVVSAIVYAATTSPEVAGQALFVSLLVSLLTRPVRGLSQTLHKVGSETNQRVSAYLSIAATFGIVYVLLLGLAGYVSVSVVSQYTVFEAALFIPAILLAVANIPAYLAVGLLGAIGRPGYISWAVSIKDFITVSVLLLLPYLVTTARELLFLFVIVTLTVYIPLVVYIGVRPTVPTRQEIVRAYEYARWSILDQVVDRLSYNMPTFVLGIVATPAAVGVYEAADRFADFGATVSYYLASTLLTKVSGDWSTGDAELQYVDSAVTGGIGITFVVLGYIIPTHQLIAQLAFPGAQRVFSFTVIAVGLINVLRGFWTLLSFVMEGVNQPSVSFKTKIYGLVVGIPPTALLGQRYGAFAGAVGYGIMNAVIFSYVVWFSYAHFERLVIDWQLLKYLGLSTIPAVITTELTVLLLVQMLELDLFFVVVVSVLIAVITYAICMYVASPKAKHVIDRAYVFYLESRL